jgi:hypothetical protein
MRHKLLWLLFILSSLGLVGCFIYQYLYIFSRDLSVPADLSDFQVVVKKFTWIITFLYGIFGFSLLAIKTTHYKRLLSYLLVLASITAIFAWLTFPTGSQDLYWNLFVGKISTLHHLDPYATTPGMYPSHPWHTPVRQWNNVPMIYGPLWTMFILAVSFPAVLGSAVILTKFIFLLVLVLSAFILWKILGLHQFSFEKKVTLFGLFCLNPTLLTQVLVDGHNDIFLLLLILLSYLFVMKKKYYYSIIMIILASFIKYTPALLVLVPLWYMFSERPLSKKELFSRIANVSIIFLISFGALWPWIAHTQFLHSIAAESQSQEANALYRYAPGAYALRDTFSFDTATIRMISAGLAVLVAFYLLFKRKVISIYTVPFAVMFLFVSWFQPWYFLWILPLALFEWSAGLFIVATLSTMLVTSTVGPIILLLPAGYALAEYLPRQ